MRYVVSQKRRGPYLIANAIVINRNAERDASSFPPHLPSRSHTHADFAPIDEIEFRERGRGTCTFAI